jgi:tRNA-dihydrouridine synthase 2
MPSKARYLDNHWSNTKFCALQFRGSHVTSKRSHERTFKDKLSKAKCYDDVTDIVGSWTGEADFAEIVEAIEARSPRRSGRIDGTTTPLEWRPNPRMAENLRAPLFPGNERRIPVPASVSGHDEPTPTPTPPTEARILRSEVNTCIAS